MIYRISGRGRLKCDDTRAETRFRLSAKRTSPFKLAGASVQSTTGSRGVRITGSNAGYTKFRGSVRVLATNSISQFPLHFPSRASPCAITFQLESNTNKFTIIQLIYFFFYLSPTNFCVINLFFQGVYFKMSLKSTTINTKIVRKVKNVLPYKDIY